MSADSTLAVHRDVLRTAADRLRAGVTALDAAVTQVQAAGAGVSSLQGWPTGDAFSGNVTNACEGCLAAARQVAGAHQAAAANLSDSAATYDAAESDSTRAVRGVAGS
ncbi:MAG TPA: hypothetical protein VG268_07335 [Streptosporangiaceae bacterium]|jgi:hypothetical protein|nr:hypothetical protein [Streptosporangiaceae bacterium]